MPPNVFLFNVRLRPTRNINAPRFHSAHNQSKLYSYIRHFVRFGEISNCLLRVTNATRVITPFDDIRTCFFNYRFIVICHSFNCRAIGVVEFVARSIKHIGGFLGI